MPGQASKNARKEKNSCMRPNDTDPSAMEVTTPRAATDTTLAFLPTLDLLPFVTWAE